MKIVKTIETMFTAITFAEAGELETAQDIMKEISKPTPKKSKKKAYFNAPRLSYI